MGCNCGKRKAFKPTINIVEQYKYLKPHQIKARLEVFKRNYCTNCDKRYKCDYNMYLNCQTRPK